MKAELVLRNARIQSRGGLIDPGFLAVSEGRLVAIGRDEDALSIEADTEVDCGGRTLTPGLIDVQVNGGGGYMFSMADERSQYEEIARAHARLGVTTICPTIVTGPPEQMLRAVELAASLCAEDPSDRARCAGIHVEGPFLDYEKRGGHTPRYLRAPSLEFAEELLDRGDGWIKIVTLAPELPGAMQLVDFFAARGVFVSAGHTGADARVMHEAAGRGMSGVTHIFNGMEGLHNRVPGVAGVALSNDSLTVGLIADLLHVSPEVCTMVLRAKPKEKLYLTTDAVSPMGSTQGSFDLYGVTVTVRDGGCYTDGGVLAGTATPLARMVGNVKDKLGFGEREALQLATTTPATVVGRNADLGVLCVGAIADIAIFDRDFNPWKVFVGGKNIEIGN
ncbi:N-acetylglucosamine-6-phosphate deacetylase [Micromonospora sp. NPDC048905]|uniref:N-acetylglucosamine-6-phosphate deacetylase n=1 Tax=Micromonospora sp. NPDC048905 TaxID=3155494 RepID=UPI0033DDA998